MSKRRNKSGAKTGLPPDISTRRPSHPAEPDPAETALTGVVAVATLQELQDGFAALGQVAVCSGNMDGEPVPFPAAGRRFA